ncbi:MAG: hypothetical protein NVS2B16_15030 [Chloroflexota bacterium]
MSEGFDSLEQHAPGGDSETTDHRQRERRTEHDRRKQRRSVLDRRSGFDRRSHPFYSPRIAEPRGPDAKPDVPDAESTQIQAKIQELYDVLRRDHPDRSKTDLWHQALTEFIERYEGRG